MENLGEVPALADILLPVPLLLWLLSCVRRASTLVTPPPFPAAPFSLRAPRCNNVLYMRGVPEEEAS